MNSWDDNSKLCFSSHVLKDAKIEERAKDEREKPSQVYIQASFPDFPLIILELQHTSEASKADLTLQSTEVTFELHALYINSNNKVRGTQKWNQKQGILLCEQSPSLLNSKTKGTFCGNGLD